MARVSRPPGFDMTYRPEKTVSFGPPLRERLPTLLYFGAAVTLCGVIAYGHVAPSTSRIFQYVVEGDGSRMISSSACAIMLLVSALAALARESMRGVVVHPDGIELRELLTLGMPRVRRYHWSQIDRVSVPNAATGSGPETSGAYPKGAPARATIRLDLWDGSRTWLPRVADMMGLAVLLERVALARAIPVEGSTGLLDDFGDGTGDDEEDQADAG